MEKFVFFLAVVALSGCRQASPPQSTEINPNHLTPLPYSEQVILRPDGAGGVRCFMFTMSGNPVIETDPIGPKGTEYRVVCI
jgi:hypothetical protein